MGGRVARSGRLRVPNMEAAVAAPAPPGFRVSQHAHTPDKPSEEHNRHGVPFVVRAGNVLPGRPAWTAPRPCRHRGLACGSETDPLLELHTAILVRRGGGGRRAGRSDFSTSRLTLPSSSLCRLHHPPPPPELPEPSKPPAVAPQTMVELTEAERALAAPEPLSAHLDAWYMDDSDADQARSWCMVG